MLVLRQEKFNLELGSNETGEFVWIIPIAYRSVTDNLTDTSGKNTLDKY